MARLKAAVIGLGRIASTIDEELGDFDGVEFPYGHIPCYMSMPEIEVVGMSDTWVEQREAAGAKWGFEALYSDYRQMLEETRPDIVSVCTSAKPRADILLEIANGGYGVRAIWAEKPITLSLAEADAAIDACKQANIALAINCTRCWRDDYLQVKAGIGRSQPRQRLLRRWPDQVPRQCSRLRAGLRQRAERKFPRHRRHRRHGPHHERRPQHPDLDVA